MTKLVRFPITDSKIAEMCNLKENEFAVFEGADVTGDPGPIKGLLKIKVYERDTDGN